VVQYNIQKSLNTETLNTANSVRKKM